MQTNYSPSFKRRFSSNTFDLFGAVFGVLWTTDMNGLRTVWVHTMIEMKFSDVLSFFFIYLEAVFLSSFPASLLVRTVSHVPTREPLLDTKHQEAKCLWTRRCSVPSSIIYQFQPPLHSSAACDSVSSNGLALISYSPTDVCGEHCGSCCCRAIYWKLLWSSNSFAKIELCLTSSVWLTEAWNCAKLSALL